MNFHLGPGTGLKVDNDCKNELSSGVFTRIFRRCVFEKISAQGFPSIVRTHASQGPRVRTEPYVSPLCLSSMPLSRGHIILLREAGDGGGLGSLWVLQTQVVCVRKR